MVGDPLEEVFGVRAFHKLEITNLLKEQLIPFFEVHPPIAFSSDEENEEMQEFEVEESERETDQVYIYIYIKDFFHIFFNNKRDTQQTLS